MIHFFKKYKGNAPYVTHGDILALLSRINDIIIAIININTVIIGQMFSTLSVCYVVLSLFLTTVIFNSWAHQIIISDTMI